MTEVSLDGEVRQRPRQTEWGGYPLPPPLPGRWKPTYNRYGQYMVPNPSTGREAAYSRATTIAAVLDDTYNLQLWIQRQIVKALLNGVRVQMAAQHPDWVGTGKDQEILKAMGSVWATDPNTQKLNKSVDFLTNIQGGRDASEFGTAIHAWLEAIDVGIVRPSEVPELFRSHTEAYRRLLTRHGMHPVPEYTERIVLNDTNGWTDTVSGMEISPSETITGTLDRIFRVITTGVLVLGDVKTSKADSLEWGVLEFCIQLAIYRFARLMLSMDGRQWEPMPTLSSSTAYLMHVPSDDPRRAACIALNVEFGSEALQVATYVRDLRRRVKREGLTGTIPIPSPEALQWAEARHAIQDISDPGDLVGIWERYSAVWTEDLTALGRQIAGLITERIGA